MKLIAHRGNINGPNSSDENNPQYIDNAINLGYDAEIDIRFDLNENKFYLGHDESQYPVTLDWLNQHQEKLWIHCKDISALFYFVNNTTEYNYFWHQEDDFTLTSKNYIWTYPGKSHTPKSIIVMPEMDLKTEFSNSLKEYDCFGICTDYISYLK